MGCGECGGCGVGVGLTATHVPVYGAALRTWGALGRPSELPVSWGGRGVQRRRPEPPHGAALRSPRPHSHPWGGATAERGTKPGPRCPERLYPQLWGSPTSIPSPSYGAAPQRPHPSAVGQPYTDNTHSYGAALHCSHPAAMGQPHTDPIPQQRGSLQPPNPSAVGQPYSDNTYSYGAAVHRPHPAAVGQRPEQSGSVLAQLRLRGSARSSPRPGAAGGTEADCALSCALPQPWGRGGAGPGAPRAEPAASSGG